MKQNGALITILQRELEIWLFRAYRFGGKIMPRRRSSAGRRMRMIDFQEGSIAVIV